MSTKVLFHRDILAADEPFLLSRAALAPSRPRALHGHDFYELIWVQNGRMRHHLPTRREDLAEGEVLFVKPEHRHALQGLGEDCLVVTVVLSPAYIAALGARHPQLADRFFWVGADEPVRFHRDARQLAALNHAALRLERGRRDTLEADAFVLPLLTDLLDMARPLPEGAPEWLAVACAAAQDPKVFREGAAGFARAAGRAHPHVSRTARKYLGQSPSDYINTQRMAFAARRLSGTTDPLAEIATDCGIPNLSHFHKLFRAHHGMTPQRYRKAHQHAIVQP